MNARLVTVAGVAAVAWAAGAVSHAQPPFDLVEKTIPELQEARQAGTVTSAQLVNAYLARIDAYDRKGPHINSFIAVNPKARDDLARNPGGSSGGTGAAVAANFAVAGLGTDTCGSIRTPASHNALVGLRSTMGLASRDGVFPMSHSQDITGPLARTVTDAAILLDATAGVDPADPVTKQGDGRAPKSHRDALKTAGTIVIPPAEHGRLKDGGFYLAIYTRGSPLGQARTQLALR